MQPRAEQSVIRTRAHLINNTTGLHSCNIRISLARNKRRKKKREAINFGAAQVQTFTVPFNLVAIVGAPRGAPPAQAASTKVSLPPDTGSRPGSAGAAQTDDGALLRNLPRRGPTAGPAAAARQNDSHLCIDTGLSHTKKKCATNASFVMKPDYAL
ncbi:hypothetical protein EVAR_67898_1 [Eumeta japonica]|uniref:Uncharacterized protein n=1 Tax=Eumeta variegata TaxID=151549 RepID=A0A4C1YW75_EUMVA|nr:hypothetical protein EVAR_67898_1 [Eumeta japonica]